MIPSAAESLLFRGCLKRRLGVRLNTDQQRRSNADLIDWLTVELKLRQADEQAGWLNG